MGSRERRRVQHLSGDIWVPEGLRDCEGKAYVEEYLRVGDLYVCPHRHLVQLHRNQEVDADGQVPGTQVVDLHRGQ